MYITNIGTSRYIDNMRTGVNPFYGFLAVVYVSQNENKYTVNFPGLVYTVSTVGGT
jgi:hypothetical protein